LQQLSESQAVTLTKSRNKIAPHGHDGGGCNRLGDRVTSVSIPWNAASLTIDVSAVSNTDNKHHKAFIFDATNDPVVADAVSP
jgi:hypothetical protein